MPIIGPAQSLLVNLLKHFYRQRTARRFALTMGASAAVYKVASFLAWRVVQGARSRSPSESRRREASASTDMRDAATLLASYFMLMLSTFHGRRLDAE